MTWPAPTSPPAPPPSRPRPPGDDRKSTARPVAAWLAATGGALVLVAAIVAVAGNWQDISAWAKVAGLLTITGAACILLLARRDTAAATFALAGAASPILVALAEHRVGPGTLDRIGATGDVLTWSAPLAGILAGLVLAVVATRRTAAPLAAAALAAPTVGLITGLTAADVDAAVWACLPGVVLIALETVVALARTDPWRRVAAPAADAIAVTTGAIALVAPAIVMAVDVPVLPIVLAGAGLSMSTVRRCSRARDLAAAGVGALAIAVTLALGAPMLGAAVVAGAVGIVATVARRASALATAGAWGAALVVAAQPAGDAAASALAVGITVTLMAAAIELRLGRTGRTPDAVTPLLAVAGALLAASCCAVGREAVLVSVLALAVVHVAVRRPAGAGTLLAVAAIASGYVGLAVVGDGEPGTIDTSFGLGLLALSAAAAMTSWRAEVSWAAHAATVSAVAAVPFGLAAVGAGAAEVAIALMILAVVLTGWAFVTIRLTPIGSAGIAAGALAAAVAYDAAEPVLVSFAVTVVGIQGALHGATRRSPELMWCGLGVAGAGTVSTWFTSGANAAVLEWLRPYGVTACDLAVAVLAMLLFAAGALAHRLVGCSSWIATGPGLGLVGAWLLGAELTRGERWSLPLLLVTGLLAVGIGGVRRLAAPLVLGTAILATTVVIAAGPRLAELDTWVWLAFGGAALIALAVLVERTVNSDEGEGIDWSRLRQTWH